LTFRDKTHKRAVGLPGRHDSCSLGNAYEDGVKHTQARQALLCVSKERFGSWIRIKKLVERLYYGGNNSF
jgi:hypothetical protein